MLEVDKVMVVGRDEATLVYTLLGGRRACAGRRNSWS